MRLMLLFISLFLTACHDEPSSVSYNLEAPISNLLFSGSTTLELYAFHQEGSVSCKDLNKPPYRLPQDAKPIAVDRADATNNAGKLSFSFQPLHPNQTYLLFVRAIDVDKNRVLATGCEENITQNPNTRKEIHLRLKPTLLSGD